MDAAAQRGLWAEYLRRLVGMAKFFAVLAWLFAPMLVLPFAVTANAQAPMWVVTGLWLLALPLFHHGVAWAVRR